MKNKKIQSVLYVLMTAVVFALSSYLFAKEFLKWSNFILLIVYMLVATVTFALATMNAAALFGKKEASKKAKIISLVVGAAVYQAIGWGMTALINVDGKFNVKAIKLTYAVLSILFGALTVIAFAKLSKRFYRPVNGLLAALSAIGALVLAFSLSCRYFDLTWTYPAYRALVPQGGVKTSVRDIRVDYEWATHKLHPTDNIGKDASFDIKLAKNEREGFQYVVYSKKGGEKVSVEVSDLSDGKGNTLPVSVFVERYSAVPGYGGMLSDEFPDALVPSYWYEDGVELTKDRLQPFYIETVSSPDSVPGVYTATLTLTNDAGEVIDSSEITAEVWDFALPDAPSSETAMGLASGTFFELNKSGRTDYGWNGSGGQTVDEIQAEVYKQHYDYLLSHRISPYTLPYDILDERADEYMSDPRVTSFMIPYAGDDDLLVKYYEKVSSNPVWAKKGYFYPIDEPGDEEAYATYTAMTERLERLCPGYNMVTPFCNEEVEIGGEKKTSVSLQTGRSSILCGVSNVVLSEGVLDEMYSVRDSLGSRLWWYVCCGPTGDYNNMFIYLDGIRNRELFWQQKQYGLTGFLYWDSIYCEKGNPWETSMTWDSYSSAGDGCLIYPGGYIGLDEPVGSFRLKQACDGLEDYDLLTLAAQKFGEDYVNEQIAKISTSGVKYNLKYEKLESVRREIGERLANG